MGAKTTKKNNPTATRVDGHPLNYLRKSLRFGGGADAETNIRPVPPSLVTYLVVAGGGGGGGGGAGAGGAGAGGLRSNHPSMPAPLVASPFSITAGTSYTVTVGYGGQGGRDSPAQFCQPGSPSVFGPIVSTGGGHGGGESNSPTGSTGGAGGSGGGNNYNNTGTAGAGNSPPTSPSQGFGGGSGSPSNSAGGGGGGAGGAGSNANAGVTAGGPGGVGLRVTIAPPSYGTPGPGGTTGWYAGGGGGAARAPNGTGGAGGGGNASGNPGTTNTGGGGAGAVTNNETGGTGGPGIVVVSYPQINSAETLVKGKTVYNKDATVSYPAGYERVVSGGEIIYIFYGVGTGTISWPYP